MAKTAQEFLDHLASNDLAPPEVLESLRKQVAKAAKPVSPGTLARLLVDHGHLTETQGERLAEMALPASKKGGSQSGVLGLEPIGNATLPVAPKSAVRPKSQAEIDAAAAALGLAPLHDEPKSAPKPTPAARPVAKPPATPSVTGAKTTPPKPVASSPSTIAKAKGIPVAAPLLDGLQPLSPLPADDLFGVAAADPLASALVLPLATPTPAGTKPVATPRPRSKAFPIIAVAMILILAIGGIAGYLLTRSNGDQEFELAEQEYQAKRFGAAEVKLTAFIADFPANSHAGKARVHRSMAKILAASPAKDNHAGMLSAAQASLPEIGGEKELSQLHAELAPLLIDMAANLAEQAREGKSAAESSEKLAQAKNALALANDGRFVPGSLRQWQRLADVEETLALAERDLGRSKALEAALASIKKNAEEGKLDAAFSELAKLLLAYPDLAGDIAILDLGKQLSKAVAAGVKTAADSSKGESSEAKSPVLASLSLANRKPTTTAETPEQTFFALAAGSVWALDGGTGKLLWSRPTGRNGGQAVTPLTPDAGSDVVLTDLFRNEVICVHPRSGGLRWRHSFQEPLAGEPLVFDGQVIVATTRGKIVGLDAQNGNGKGAAQLPQGVRLGPVEGSGKVMVVAEHSFLYVLSPELKCEGAVYLGHEPGSIETPPTILSGHAVVTENRPAASLLHITALDGKGLAAGPSQQVEVTGQVITPPVQLGENLFVLTDQQTVVFNYLPNGDVPLKKLGETKANSAQTLARFGAVHAGKLWIADDGLRRYDFLPAGGTLKEAWTGFAGETLDSPPLSAGDAIFCLRRVLSRPGVTATAVKSTSGETLWETQLAQPIQSLTIAADKQSAVVVSAAGGEAKVDLAGLKGASAVFLAFPVPPKISKLSWAGGLVSISDSVQLDDPANETELANPFQMRVRPGIPIGSPSAAAAGSNGESLVVSDGGTLLYHLRLEKEPRPRLVQVAKTSLTRPAISSVAVLGDSIFIVNNLDGLVVLQLSDMTKFKVVELNCRAVPFGPEPVGQSILVATDRQELACLDGSGKLLWKIPLTAGPLAGRPQVVEKDFVLPIRSGILLRISASSGKEVARANVGQPLAGPTALVDGGLLVSTAAGGVLKVAIPEKK